MRAQVWSLRVVRKFGGTVSLEIYQGHSGCVAAIPGGRLRLALHGHGLSPNSNFLVLAIIGEHRTL